MASPAPQVRRLVAAFSPTRPAAAWLAAARAAAPIAKAAPTTTGAAAPTTATTRAAPIFTRSGQVDGQLAIAEPIAVEHRDGFLGFSLRAHFNKAKAFRLPSVTVLDDRHRRHRTSLGEQGP